MAFPHKRFSLKAFFEEGTNRMDDMDGMDNMDKAVGATLAVALSILSIPSILSIRLRLVFCRAFAILCGSQNHSER